MKLICFGDSLTFGSVGHSYIKYLKRATSYQVKNKGINGDTIMHMCSRLNRYLKGANSEHPDTYIICIGVNDLLLPYLASLSLPWKIMMAPRIRARQCLIKDDWFKKKYQRMIRSVIAKKQKIIVMGMPYLEIKDFPNHKIKERNAMIEELAEKYHVTYIDITKIQKQLDDGKRKEHSWQHKSLFCIIEGVAFSLCPMLKDPASKARQLTFTCDGVHWNSKLAKAVSEKIREEV